MREPPATPQLPLDFEKQEDLKESKTGFLQSCNVVALKIVGVRRQPKQSDEVDSVLEDVLSNARKLNW